VNYGCLFSIVAAQFVAVSPIYGQLLRPRVPKAFQIDCAAWSEDDFSVSSTKSNFNIGEAAMSDLITRTIAGAALLVSVVVCGLLYDLDQSVALQHDQVITALGQLSRDLNQRNAAGEASDAETPVETAVIPIDEGWLASTIPVVATSVAHDLVRPGSVVDVLCRIHGTDGAPDHTMTLLEAVHVRSVEVNSGDGRPMVSLILNPQQVKMVADVADQADFHLVLRHPTDQTRLVPIDLAPPG